MKLQDEIEYKHYGVYKHRDGYFVLNKQDNVYKFIPSEKEFNEQHLVNILHLLKLLNANINDHYQTKTI